MRRLFSLALIVLILATLPIQGRILKIKELPKHYRQWLSEEVVYIISPIEKNAFLQLENDREREIFINAFWKQRDPNRNTEENEFKKEHLERIAYANQWFGKEEPAPGWRSEQGRIYIILGEPNHKEKFYNLTEVKNMEIWFYGQRPEMGLYSAFNVVFFKQSPSEPYRLYSPIKYGPASLLNNYEGDTVDYQAAYNQLYAIEPTIANISLTLIPGETQTTTSPSISSEILISSKIPKAPTVKINSGYAEKILKYRGIVNVNYLVNYVDRDAMVRVFRDSSGTAFMHYIIEPKRLSLERYDDSLYTNIEASGRITDLNGKTIYQFTRKSPVKMDSSRTSALTSRLFSFQDMIPLVNGTYKYSILLRNSAQDEFTTIEGDVMVPDSSRLRMSPVLLAHRLIKNPTAADRFKPFLLGGAQLVPSPRNDFNAADTLTIYFQLIGAEPDLKAGGNVVVTIQGDRNKEEVWRKEMPLSSIPDLNNIFFSLPLKDYATDYYQVEVAVMNAAGRRLLQEQASFLIAPFKLKRAWVMSLPYSRSESARNDHILGNQYRLLGNMKKAREMLQRARNADPLSPTYARDYAGLLLHLKEYDLLPPVLEPFLEGEHKNMFLMIRAEVARRRGDWKSALELGEEYLQHNGVNYHVLNVMGESLMHLGNHDEAIKVFNRSLEENPLQPSVKAMVARLKREKKNGEQKSKDES